MLQKITLLFMSLCLAMLAGNAQNTWSLEKCIDYARQNNLSVKQAEYSIKNTDLTRKQNEFNRLPGLSGRTSGGLQFGRTIDPTTNSFNTEQITFNSFSIDLNATLYSGNRLNNAVKQSRIDLEAARLDAQATVNDIGLSIANAYLSILLAEEQLENARRRLELSQSQLDQTDKLIRAGSLPPNDRLDFLSQIALDEQSIIEAQNLVAIGYLNLKQIMEIDPNEDIRIVRPESINIPEGVDPQGFQLNEVYNAALQTQPQIRAADLRLESAQLEENIAHAGFLPTLSLFASLNTNYSSAFQSPIFGLVRSKQTVFINNDPVEIEFENEAPVDYKNIAFGKQFNDNFGQTVG
ncbi:MAG TPA: TolC family protein, partial [Saprospiraceae bacterium]|nr:TolC family protein [Saprospiraceae bacterium]